MVHLIKVVLEGSAENEKVTVAEANAQLQQLAFSGSTRGDASVTVTVSDGFSSSSEIIYLTIPNTAPTITVPKENLSAKIGGLPFSLTSIDVSDVDSIDRGPDATISLSLSSTNGIFATQFPSLTDTGQTFDHDSDAGETTQEIAVQTFNVGNENIFLLQEGAVINILNPKNIFQPKFVLFLAGI